MTFRDYGKAGWRLWQSSPWGVLTLALMTQAVAEPTPGTGTFLAGAAAMLAAVGWLAKLFVVDRVSRREDVGFARESDVRWQAELRELARSNRDLVEQLATFTREEFRSTRELLRAVNDNQRNLQQLIERLHVREGD